MEPCGEGKQVPGYPAGCWGGSGPGGHSINTHTGVSPRDGASSQGGTLALLHPSRLGRLNPQCHRVGPSGAFPGQTPAHILHLLLFVERLYPPGPRPTPKSQKAHLVREVRKCRIKGKESSKTKPSRFSHQS